MLEIDDLFRAAESHDGIVEALKDLVQALEFGDSRRDAISVLHELSERLMKNPLPHLLLRVVNVPGLDEPIKLFLTPAVFSPELWGQTFAEGLLKFPEQFHGTRVLELGTGSGWISLLLLTKTQVKEVIGLDINPVAVTLARVNAWLNGTTPDGGIVLSQAGQPIIGSFRVIESDLLLQVIETGDKFDHIIGCIPQVLHPKAFLSVASARPSPVLESSSERSIANGADSLLSAGELYDLSNYCFEQGILEDRFGLPLIARALEQSQLCLQPGGKVMLILGGRPGPHAIESMFLRRGFEPEMIWSRRIPQADDTDLASLVELEQAHGIQFHFFVGRDSRQSISAGTAVKLLKQNRQVYHDLLVYQATTQFEKSTFGFVSNLSKLKLDSLRKELDFSRMSEEQMSFLQRLSESFLQLDAIPYPHERGDLSLRKRLASFLRIYCHTSLDPGKLFVAPERRVLLSMILDMLAEPGSPILMSESLRPVYGNLAEGSQRARSGSNVSASAVSCSKSKSETLGASPAQLETIWGNDDLAELMELDEVLAPKIVVIAPRQFSRPSPINLKAMFDHARQHPQQLYIIDDSQNFDIDSNLEANMTLRIASQMEIPKNVILLYGLIKNTVCPDFELSFLVNAPDAWSDYLDVGAELTYSRIPYPSQLYYEWLFDDLLSFPFPSTAPVSVKANHRTEKFLRANFKIAADDVVFAPKPVSLDDPNLIRLDYGEYEHNVPDLLVRGLIKGFVEEPSDALPALIKERVCSYIAFTRGAGISPERVVLGQGVFPLLGAFLKTIKKRLGRSPLVAVPNGSYGLIFPMIAYHGAEIVPIETKESSGFVVSAEDVKNLKCKPDILWLTQPNNPSGLMFDSTSVKSLLDICVSEQIYLFADEIFFLLSDHRLGSWTLPYLSFASQLADPTVSKYIFVADGASKAFAAGGLRCGFMVTPDRWFASEIQTHLQPPPKAMLRAWDNLYVAFLDEAPHALVDMTAARQEVYEYLLACRKQLATQRDELLSVLRKHGLDDQLDTPYRGGLFVIGRLADRQDELARRFGLLINPDDWGRTPGWSRMCFSLPPEKFKLALTRLEEALFKK